MDYSNPSQKADNGRKKSATIRMARSKGQKKKRMEKWVLFLLFENADGPSFWQSKEILRVPILPTESWPRGYWHVPS